MTQSVYGCLKWCAHIASTAQNEGPLPRTQGGTWDRVIEFICICSASVTNIGGKISKLKLWTRIYIVIDERRCTSQQNHLKMWSIYWVMSFKALDTAECLLKRYQWKAIVRLQHAWLMWSLNESIVTLLIRPDRLHTD